MVDNNRYKLLQLVFLSIFLSLFITPFVIAAIPDCEFNLPPVKSGDCKELIQTCSSCRFLNITKIYFPNQTSLNLNAEMTQFVNTYNYTFCDTDDVGVYIYSTFGDPDGVLSTGNVCFESTVDGTNLSGVQTALLFIPLFLFSFLLVMFGRRFFISSTTSSKAVYFLLTYTIALLPLTFIIYTLANNYLNSQTFIINILFYFFYILVILTPIVFIISIAYMIVDAVNQSKRQKLINRGHNEEHADDRIKRR